MFRCQTAPDGRDGFRRHVTSHTKKQLKIKQKTIYSLRIITKPGFSKKNPLTIYGFEKLVSKKKAEQVSWDLFASYFIFSARWKILDLMLKIGLFLDLFVYIYKITF